MADDKRSILDFDRALLIGFWRKVASRLTGASNDLLPFDEVRSRLPLLGQRYRGIEQVPIDRIVGSVGRFRDFDRAFFPIQSGTKDRWTRISRATYEGVPLPPVDLYKIGDAYFVADGNHRLSVARERGQAWIDARVTEIEVPVPVSPTSDLEELALAEERTRFLEATGLPRVRPEARIAPEIPGQYDKLLAHIFAHRWYMGQERGGDVPMEEAVASWYDLFYRPMVELLREHGIPRVFGGCSEADLFLWIVDYQDFLRQALESASAEPEKDARRRFLDAGGADAAQPTRRLVRLLSRADWVHDRLRQESYARFLQATKLVEVRPAANLVTTLPGAYGKLEQHLATHRWYLGEERGGEVTAEEAAASWYDRVYLPLVEIVREQNVLAQFPGRTEADLYLWIIERQWFLRTGEGIEEPAEEAVQAVAKEKAGRAGPRWWRRARRWRRR